MKPAIHDGLVLYAPIEHPERMAAGMSAANSDGKMHSREYTPFTPWPLWKLALHALGLALLMGAVCSPLWWA